MKKLAIAVLSLVTAFSGIAPAQAFPTLGPPRIEAPKDIQQVQYWRDRDRWDNDRWERRRHYRDRYDRRDRGPNVGAVIGGLALGAIIGGALAQPRYSQPRYYRQGYYQEGYYQPRYAPRRYHGPHRYVGGSSHVRWCYARYRSYRAYDNTFQPNYGPRRQCHSPYR